MSDHAAPPSPEQIEQLIAMAEDCQRAPHVTERTRATEEWREATDYDALLPWLRAYADLLRRVERLEKWLDAEADCADGDLSGYMDAQEQVERILKGDAR